MTAATDALPLVAGQDGARARGTSTGVLSTWQRLRQDVADDLSSLGGGDDRQAGQPGDRVCAQGFDQVGLVGVVEGRKLTSRMAATSAAVSARVIQEMDNGESLSEQGDPGSSWSGRDPGAEDDVGNGGRRDRGHQLSSLPRSNRWPAQTLTNSAYTSQLIYQLSGTASAVVGSRSAGPAGSQVSSTSRYGCQRPSRSSRIWQTTAPEVVSRFWSTEISRSSSAAASNSVRARARSPASGVH